MDIIAEEPEVARSIHQTSWFTAQGYPSRTHSPRKDILPALIHTHANSHSDHLIRDPSGAHEANNRVGEVSIHSHGGGNGQGHAGNQSHA